MRLVVVSLLALAFAGPAPAAAPRFGLFDLGRDLAPASHNVYGDVRVASSRDALARRAPGATVVRCAADCRLGRGRLAFATASRLAARDLVAVRAHAGARGWSISVGLSARGQTAWKRLAAAARKQTARTGLPPVLVVVVDGAILATPYGSEVRLRKGVLELTGFERAAAKRAPALLTSNRG